MLEEAFEYGASYIKCEDCRNTRTYTLLNYVPPCDARIEKVDNLHYKVLSSGEIREYERGCTGTKADHLRSVKRAFNNLKKLINCNYDEPCNVRFFTLTYAENMQDNGRISDDWRQFVKRCRRRYGQFRYLYVKEQQERGAWHLHGFFFFDGAAPYMDNSEVAAMWGHGFVMIEAIKDDLNNLGNYLCAYLTDDKETGKKGARLLNYDAGIRLYNCSRDIRRPVVSPVTSNSYLEERNSSDLVLISAKESIIGLPSGQTVLNRYELYRIV